MPGEDLPEVVIRRWADVPDKGRLIPAIDTIFFEGEQYQSRLQARRSAAAFRERWLGKYLRTSRSLPTWRSRATDASPGHLVGSVLEPVGFEAFANAAWEIRAPACEPRAAIPRPRHPAAG